MTNPMNDKRHFHRIFFNSDVTLSNQSTKLPCKLVDISLQGCLLQFEEKQFEENWTGDLDGLYTLNLNLSDEISITMQTSVAHVVGSNVGFKCEHIDIDSISQLRRLVELNLGDSDLLERDLLALAEFKEH
ncbi:MAG: PilZ domain-containing protein [Methylococcaceae bacterium]|nr:PilZ domain-containing protein [Methylococcaceae bacterium]